MRDCRSCGQSKPLMEFYLQSSGTLQRDCKDCWKAYVRANRLARSEQYKAYDRGRANLPHRVEARKSYAATEGGRIAGSRAKRRYTERNPIKRDAVNAVQRAVRAGRLNRQPCEVCGFERAQAHHDDYSKPLDVRWLCTKHHAEWHRHNEPLCPDQEKAA